MDMRECGHSGNYQFEIVRRGFVSEGDEELPYLNDGMEPICPGMANAERTTCTYLARSN